MMEIAAAAAPVPTAKRSVSLSFHAKLVTITFTTTSIRKAKSWKAATVVASSVPTTSSSRAFYQTVTGQTEKTKEASTSKKRVFFLDVNPLCYSGSTPSLHSFAHWISLFFSQVSGKNPVIAVVDGERGNEYRRRLLPSYKSHRNPQRFQKGLVERSHYAVLELLKECNVPVVKYEDHEADDVVATLVDQAVESGYRVVIASPDKDFKQLISDKVQIVIPMPELNRWSFYTIKHYMEQYSCYPLSDLSLRCIIGDEVDGIPGIQHVAPGFGRKTALKLIKKHGTLENLLNAVAVRTVGKQYAQDALMKHADYLRRNYEVLSLRRDLDVHLKIEWLSERDTRSDSLVASKFLKMLEETRKFKRKTECHS